MICKWITSNINPFETGKTWDLLKKFNGTHNKRDENINTLSISCSVKIHKPLITNMYLQSHVGLFPRQQHFQNPIEFVKNDLLQHFLGFPSSFSNKLQSFIDCTEILLSKSKVYKEEFAEK